MDDLEWRHLRGEIIPWAVRWCRRRAIGRRERAEMMAERGVMAGEPAFRRAGVPVRPRGI